MKQIELDLSQEPVLIELTTNDYGRDAIGIKISRESIQDCELMIEIQREETLRTTMVSTYSEDNQGFIYSIKKSLVEEPGEKPAMITIIDVFEEIREEYPAKWIITQAEEDK